MKRTKQLQMVIDETNKYLRNNKIKDQSNPAFSVVQHSLLEMGTYQGFNYFNDRKIGDKVIPILAGSSVNFEFLQIY